MPGSQGFVSPIVTVKSSLGELFGAYGWMRIAGGRHLQPEGLSPSAVGQMLILTFGGTTKMFNFVGGRRSCNFPPSSAAIRQTWALSATRLFESRLPASSNGVRFQARKIEKSMASILGLKARVVEQAATNDDVMMEPATGPET
jgi:hypothetical protein